MIKNNLYISHLMYNIYFSNKKINVLISIFINYPKDEKCMLILDNIISDYVKFCCCVYFILAKPQANMIILTCKKCTFVPLSHKSRNAAWVPICFLDLSHQCFASAFYSIKRKSFTKISCLHFYRFSSQHILVYKDDLADNRYRFPLVYFKSVGVSK